MALYIGPVSLGCSPFSTTVASANFLLIRVILIRRWSPGFPFGTKTTKPSMRAMPSPRWLVSVMSTSYSSSIFTGFGGSLPPRNPPSRRPPEFSSIITFHLCSGHWGKTAWGGLQNCELAEFSNVKLDFAFEACYVAVFDFDFVVDVDLVYLLVPKGQLYGSSFILHHCVCHVVGFVFESGLHLAGVGFFHYCGFNFDSFHSVSQFINFQQLNSPRCLPSENSCSAG